MNFKQEKFFILKQLKNTKKINYLHIELVQVGFKPLSCEGLDTPLFACLRDCRFLDFTDSLLGTIETTLCNGPIYFGCYPTFTLQFY